MQNEFIIINDYCKHSNIEPDFILMLNEDGLIDIKMVDEVNCFPASQLNEIERYAHLYYDLSINIAGIDAIRHLLKRMEDMQLRIKKLENELKFYR